MPAAQGSVEHLQNGRVWARGGGGGHGKEGLRVSPGQGEQGPVKWGGSLFPLHSEHTCSQPGFIALFKVVENFRTSDTPSSNARTETPSKTSKN